MLALNALSHSSDHFLYLVLNLASVTHLGVEVGVVAPLAKLTLLLLGISISITLIDVLIELVAVRSLVVAIVLVLLATLVLLISTIG